MNKKSYQSAIEQKTFASGNVLQVSGLTVSFGGIKALTDVSFDVGLGSITALIGPNGAGKTTVFNCITGFYRANKGHIHFMGKNALVEISALLGAKLDWSRSLNPKKLLWNLWASVMGGSHMVARSGVARTFQNIRLFRDMTVLENLLVAQHDRVSKNILSAFFRLRSFQKKENEAIERAEHWLDVFQLSSHRDRLAGELSYGLQRRLEMARAMCIEPKLICLDEPAAGLNPNETADLSLLIKRLRNEFGVTVFVIEHDMSMVMSISDRIIVLDRGQVIAEGKPEEIKSNPAVISAYLGVES